MKNVLKALAKFQENVPVIHQETKGYNYTYANLNKIFETIKPLLKSNGLAFTQLLDGKNLKTIVYHVETGESIEGSVEIETNVKLAGMNHYQVYGSAITYFRRYSLTCVLGLITDKDIDACGDVDTEATLKDCKTLDELKDVYSNLTKSDQSKYIKLKDKLKLKLK